ncbi:hypothetical protein BJY04DRAFT_223380 [Aspergillus karnatakaensis]|uniref:uncharacterized protein n=1 Tax=Aspergillus karnatakaensis TaxID=1810916 RepID=UPI003CCD460B
MVSLLELQSSAKHATTLHLTYLPVLNRVLGSDPTDQERERIIARFRTIVGSILILVEPLSITQLASLLDTAKREVQSTLEPLHAVLNIPGEESPVRPFHASFSDFLLEKDPNDDTFHIDSPSTHRYLALQCLARMSRTTHPTGLRKNICNLDLPEELDQTIEHETIDTEWVILNGDAVHYFLETHFLGWIEAVALLKKASTIAYSLKVLLSLVGQTRDQEKPSRTAHSSRGLWSTSNKLDLQAPADTSVSAFIHDARRFVRSNNVAIQRAPLLIYASLAFSPESSIIRNKFNNYCPDWLVQLPTISSSWDTGLHIDCQYTDYSFLSFSKDRLKLLMDTEVWDTISGHLYGRLDSLLDSSSNGLAVKKLTEGSIIRCAAFASDHDVIIILEDGHAVLWNVSTGELTVRFLGYRRIRVAAISQTRNTVAFLSEMENEERGSSEPGNDSKWLLAVCDAVTGDLHICDEFYSPRYTDKKPRATSCLALSTDACTVARASSSSDIAKIKIFDLSGTRPDGSTVLQYKGEVTTLALSSNGSRLAIGLAPDIKIIDTDNGRFVCKTRRRRLPRYCGPKYMSFARGNRSIVFSDSSFHFRDENMLYSALTGRLQGGEDCSGKFAVSPDGSEIAIRGIPNGQYFQVHSIDSLHNRPAPWEQPSTHLNKIRSSIMALDGSRAATMAEEMKIIFLWDPKTRQVINQVKSRSYGKHFRAAFSKNGAAFATDSRYDRGRDNHKTCLEVWRLDTGTPVRRLKIKLGFRRLPPPFALNRDGTRAVLCVSELSSDAINEINLVQEWDVITGKHLYTHVIAGPYRIRKLGYSSDWSTIHFRGRGRKRAYVHHRSRVDWNNDRSDDDLLEEHEGDKTKRSGYIHAWNPTFPSSSSGTPQVHESVGEAAQSSLSVISNRYIMPLVVDSSPACYADYNTAKSGSKHIITIKNTYDNIISFTVDEEKLRNCPRP